MSMVLKNKWPNFQSSRSCTYTGYTLFLPQEGGGGRNWAYFCLTESGFRDTGPFTKLQYSDIWARNLFIMFIGQSSRSCTYTFFLPQGGWNLCSMGSGFWDTGQVSKLPYLGMKLLKWSKFQKLHINSVSTPQGRNWAYFGSTGSVFRDTWDMGHFSKLPYLGMKLGKWPKFQKLHIYSVSTPGGRDWAYLGSTGSGFHYGYTWVKIKLVKSHKPAVFCNSIYTWSSELNKRFLFCELRFALLAKERLASFMPPLLVTADSWASPPIKLRSDEPVH